jgi:alanine racemase
MNDEKTAQQLQEFLRARESLESHGIRPEVWHCANSFGAEHHPSSRQDLVRVGMHAYGIDGRPDSPFRPVMALKSRIVADRIVPQGATVGYNATWEAPRPTRILTIGAGYGDGYPRHLSGCSSVLIHGVPCPVRGIICMDLFMVEGDAVPDAKVGDEVTLLGPGASASQLAAWAGTNAHEIVTRIAPRVPRRYLNL